MKGVFTAYISNSVPHIVQTIARALLGFSIKALAIVGNAEDKCVRTVAVFKRSSNEQFRGVGVFEGIVSSLFDDQIYIPKQAGRDMHWW
jgi:hypothetical protein